MSVARGHAAPRRAGGPERELERRLRARAGRAAANLRFLREAMPEALSGLLRDDPDAAADLALGLDRLGRDRELVLVDRGASLLVARLDTPGSIFETLRRWPDRAVAAAEIDHSRAPVPGSAHLLELQRYRFERDAGPDLRAVEPLPAALRRAVREALHARTPRLAPREADALLGVLWAHDAAWVRCAPPAEVAGLVLALHGCRAHGGAFLDLDAPEGAAEGHLRFAVADPPLRGFLTQVMEVLNTLDLGVQRCTAFTLEGEKQPVFLGSFRIARRSGAPLLEDAATLQRLRRQLHSTRILAAESPTYHAFVLSGRMTSEEASLVDALIGFCHTTCAHAQPDRYTFEDVIRAFHSDLDLSLRLVRLFALRFDPDLAEADRATRWPEALAELERDVAGYDTGHRRLDAFRKSVFRTALLFVRHTLKTNFFVAEKHALAFRLSPAYLDDLGPEFTSDLPADRPFRVTFFFGRGALGYHVGFADIARGGWRTILTRTRDDYVTVANTAFRETYVLAHTQHLKNKDIYEGGSKLVTVVRAQDADTREAQDRRLHKVQRAFASAFLDVFVTEGGRARDGRVVDHYREDEPIELGPDENMHDEMIEEIAALSVRRGYVLGAGIMSSKRVGINHKQYGVTSTGVVTFAEIAMRERGIDLRRDPFTVTLTGGPNGDVAGNTLRLLLERSPGARIRLVVDGTAALYDPAGLDHAALGRIVLRADADAFDPERLSPGGVLLFRNLRRTDGMRTLHRRLERTADGLRLEESWVTADEFHREYGSRIFEVETDLFIPAGGRPETVDASTWRRFLGPDGKPRVGVVVEGANSFLSPDARRGLQEAGVVVLRDASANKCGVISSSYEIIGNLLLSEREFLEHKEAYVRDVLEILERRAADEARLLFRRRAEEGGKRSFTELSDAISREINAHEARLFGFFEAQPALALRAPYRQALLAHLPRMIRESPRLRGRVTRLPPKYRSAILAAEIATSLVYRRPLEPDFAAALSEYVAETFGSGTAPSA